MGMKNTSFLQSSRVIKIVFTLLSILFWTQSTFAADYYVSLSGNDASAGSLSAPFKTIAKGMAVLKAGDILYLREGIYTERIDSNRQQIPIGSSWNSPVTIMSYPGETATLRPSGGDYVIGLSHGYIKYLIIDGLVVDGALLTKPTNTADGSGQTNISIWGGANHIRIKNCELKNSPGQGITIFPGNGLSSDFNELINCKIHHNGSSDFDHGIYISTHNNLIEGNEFYNNSGWGIHKYPKGDHNIIRNNRVHDNAFVGKRGPGMGLYGGTGNLVYNNLVWGNQYGIAIDYGEVGIKVYNNTIFKNVGSCIQNGTSSTNAMIINNICWKNSMALENLGSVQTASNNLSTDPKFVNEFTFDFHLQSTSPSIDAGVPLSEVTVDISGQSRPAGKGHDVGAYEYSVSMPTPPITKAPKSPKNLKIQ